MVKYLRLLLWIYKYGFINLFYRFNNKKSIQIKESKSFPPGGTSIADSDLFGAFPTLCGLAAEDDQIFSTFRRYEIFLKVVDFVRMEQGFLYIDEILKHELGGVNISNNYKKTLKSIDSVGKPKKYRFNGHGIYSPNALKYLKVYLDLRKLFGDLSNFKLTEIGVGFGGQASVINQLNKPISYHLYDIPPVLNLASRVLNKLNLGGNFHLMDGRQPEFFNSDLLISNDAFSELSREIQDKYLKNVVINAKRGYITWNSWSSTHLGGYSLAELVRVIPNSQIIPEQPLTGKENAIIVWGL
jgi:hypothetical protein